MKGRAQGRHRLGRDWGAQAADSRLAAGRARAAHIRPRRPAAFQAQRGTPRPRPPARPGMCGIFLLAAARRREDFPSGQGPGISPPPPARPRGRGAPTPGPPGRPQLPGRWGERGAFASGTREAGGGRAPSPARGGAARRGREGRPGRSLRGAGSRAQSETPGACGSAGSGAGLRALGPDAPRRPWR